MQQEMPTAQEKEEACKACEAMERVPATSKPREPQGLAMCQALSLSEEEEQEVQEIFVQVRLQEERSFWEVERCN